MDIKYGQLEFSQDIKKIIISSPNTTNPAFIPEPNTYQKVFSNELFEVDQVIDHMNDHRYYEILTRLMEHEEVNIVVVNEPLYDKDSDRTNNVHIDIVNININQNINTQNIFKLNTDEQIEEFKKVYNKSNLLDMKFSTKLRKEQEQEQL
jgi:hypothetical protein